jgi:hypothetical protein
MPAGGHSGGSALSASVAESYQRPSNGSPQQRVRHQMVSLGLPDMIRLGRQQAASCLQTSGGVHRHAAMAFCKESMQRVEVVDEASNPVMCSSCGALTGPAGSGCLSAGGRHVLKVSVILPGTDADAGAGCEHRGEA